MYLICWILMEMEFYHLMKQPKGIKLYMVLLLDIVLLNKKMMSGDKMKAAFKLFDANSDGRINLNEMK